MGKVTLDIEMGRKKTAKTACGNLNESITTMTKSCDKLPSGQELVMNSIIAHRLRKKTKKLEYLVRWKNHALEYDTWELEENIPTPHLLDQYQRNKIKNNSSKYSQKIKQDQSITKVNEPKMSHQANEQNATGR